MGKIAHEQVKLLTDYDTTSQYTLAYQNLFTNIRFDWDQDNAKQHTITFVTPAEQGSWAIRYHQRSDCSSAKRRPTVLVDADLSTPSLQRHFGAQEQQGLSELLHEDTTTSHSISQSLSKTFIPNLSLLSAGSPLHQPIEISRLLSARLPNIIDGIRQHLETNESQPSLIVLHSPPMSRGTDASLISSIVDQTFLLIIKGQTKRTQVQKAQEQLERAHAKLAGVIMLDA